MHHLLLVILSLFSSTIVVEKKSELPRLAPNLAVAGKEKADVADTDELLLPPPKLLVPGLKEDCPDCPKPMPTPPPPPQLPPEMPAPVVTLQVLAPADSGESKEIEYRLLLQNCSPVPAYQVTLKNTLPKNATFVRADLTPQISGKELRWELGTMEPGARRAILLVLAPTGPGKVVNCPRVSFEHGVCVETCTNAKAVEKPVEPPPPIPAHPPGVDLKNGRVALNLKAPERQGITSPVVYQLTVTNEGNILLTDVVLLARYPAGAVYVSATGTAQHLGLEARQVRWTLGTLEAGKSSTVELQVRATQAGKLILQADVTAQSSSGVVRAARQAETEIYGQGALHMEVVDTLDPVLVGEETQYTILVRNQGDGPLTNIRISALAPPEIGVIRVQGAVNFRKEGQLLVIDPFDLPARNETVFRVTTQAIKAGFVRFAVSLTADQLPKGTLREEEATNILSDPDGELVFRPRERVNTAKPAEKGK